MSSAIILFGHGSRDPLWRLPIEAVAARIRDAGHGAIVRCAYLELTEPDLPSVVRQLAAEAVTSVSVLPMFLGVGRHAREDLPAIVAQLRLSHPGIAITLRPSVGEDPRLIDLLARIAAE